MSAIRNQARARRLNFYVSKFGRRCSIFFKS